MKYFRSPSLVPPGGFFYVDPETGRRIEGCSAQVTESKVVDFLIANKRKIPQHLNQLIADQVCAANPDFCGDTDPPSLAERIRTASASLSGFFQTGFKVATSELYVKRREICQQCELYRGDRGIGYDYCAKCGCCTSMKLYLPESTCPHPSGPKWTKEAV